MYIKTKSELAPIREAILAELEQSRFTARVYELNHYRYRTCLCIDTIRLRHPKLYCGQHPGPCLALFPKPERRYAYLEGADWIGWNDMLNTVLDRLGVEAKVWSLNREAIKSYFLIRDGCRRRVCYEYEVVGLNAVGWAEASDDDFEHWIGKEAPRSCFPDGTPGLAEWRLELEDEIHEREMSASR
jgi:hypothetical protein